MSEILTVKGLIVDSEQPKASSIEHSFEEKGGDIVSVVSSLNEVENLAETGVLHPDNLDVVFIDTDLGDPISNGREVLEYLFLNSLIRESFGLNLAGEIRHQKPSLGRIVTVGTSRNPAESAELGSCSDELNKPLAIEWGAFSPLNMFEIIAEVRRLRTA